MKKFFLFFLCLFALTLTAAAEEEQTDPHSTFQTAQVINEPVTGILSTSGEVDYYRVNVEEAGVLGLVFEHDPLTGSYDATQFYWNVKVYGGNDFTSPLMNVDIAGSKLKSTFYEFGVEEGAYYLKITSSTRYVKLPYTAALNFSADETWEKLNHGTFQAAQTLLPEVLVNGNTRNSKDRDVYKYYLDDPGYVYFDFSHSYLEDSDYPRWTVSVYTDDHLVIGKYDINGNSSAETFGYFNLPAGNCYLAIAPYSEVNYSMAHYQLTLNYVQSEGWEVEYDDTVDTAYVIDLDTTVTGSVQYLGDVDCFKTTLPADGILSVSFQHPLFEESTQFWTVTLCDKANKAVATFGSTGLELSKTSTPIGVPAGVYYAKVTSGGASYRNAPYQLAFHFTAADGWEKEYNDDFASANSLAVRTNIKGCVSSATDADLFTFALPAPGKVSPWFDHDYLDTAEACWQLDLYDSTRAPIHQFLVPGSVTKLRPSFVELGAGTYYLKVTDVSGTPTLFPYTLYLNTDVNPVTGVTLDADALTLVIGDHRQLTATIAPANATVSQLIWTSSDPTVASVDDAGYVTALGGGYATITVTTQDGGFTASCLVTSVLRSGNDYTLGQLSLRGAAGQGALDAIPQNSSFWVTVPITKNVALGDAVVLVAAYDSENRFLQLFAADMAGLEKDQTLRLSFCVNTRGVARVKAFTIASLDDFSPLAPASEFPRP